MENGLCPLLHCAQALAGLFLVPLTARLFSAALPLGVWFVSWFRGSHWPQPFVSQGPWHPSSSLEVTPCGSSGLHFYQHPGICPHIQAYLSIFQSIFTKVLSLLKMTKNRECSLNRDIRVTSLALDSGSGNQRYHIGHLLFMVFG